MPDSSVLVLKVTDQYDTEVTLKFSSLSEPVQLEGIRYEIVTIQRKEEELPKVKKRPTKMMVGAFEIIHDGSRQNECQQPSQQEGAQKSESPT